MGGGDGNSEDSSANAAATRPSRSRRISMGDPSDAGLYGTGGALRRKTCSPLAYDVHAMVGMVRSVYACCLHKHAAEESPADRVLCEDAGAGTGEERTGFWADALAVPRGW